MPMPIDELPWSALQIREPEIRWDDLRALADAAAESAEVRARLMRDADRLLSRWETDDDPGELELTDLAVPAVFALAAERLGDAERREAARFLIDMLERAGELFDESLMEALECATGRLGPALIPPALELIESKGLDLECWDYLWSLLRVGKDADEPTRAALLQLSRRMIQEAAEWEHFGINYGAASVLEELDPAGSTPLFRDLYEKTRDPELKDILDGIDGLRAPYDEVLRRPWLEPAEKWLPRIVEQIRADMADDGEEWDHDEDDEPGWLFDETDERRRMFDDTGELNPLFVPPAAEHSPSPLEEYYLDSLIDSDAPEISGETPIVRDAPKIGRNDPCPCGSGKKYKKCCGKD
jgi:hypothetical protein